MDKNHNHVKLLSLGEKKQPQRNCSPIMPKIMLQQKKQSLNRKQTEAHIGVFQTPQQSDKIKYIVLVFSYHCWPISRRHFPMPAYWGSNTVHPSSRVLSLTFHLSEQTPVSPVSIIILFLF